MVGLFLFLNGMTGALAPFSYIVIHRCLCFKLASVRRLSFVQQTNQVNILFENVLLLLLFRITNGLENFLRTN
jgi:hypothetical protein